jgi:MoxR-like ATPase
VSPSVSEISDSVNRTLPRFLEAAEEIHKTIVGQRDLVQRLLIGLLADGHILVEGVPGLAKTTAVRTVAEVLGAKFHRIQFTPDLLPADLVGTQVYSPKDGAFHIKHGPVFANLILADEINRAPAKVQSALLEAMQERQVTIGEESFPLPRPFLVMATQNPLEQEGTYPLPEAQLDRFMLKVKVTYPSREEEIQILKTQGGAPAAAPMAKLDTQTLLTARETVNGIFVDDKIYDYVANLVFATRTPETAGLSELRPLIACGASPRASLYLIRSAKAQAFLAGRGYVTPQDIKSLGLDVLRHRVLVSYEAEAQGTSSEDVVRRIFDRVDVP